MRDRGKRKGKAETAAYSSLGKEEKGCKRRSMG